MFYFSCIYLQHTYLFFGWRGGRQGINVWQEDPDFEGNSIINSSPPLESYPVIDLLAETVSVIAISPVVSWMVLQNFLQNAAFDTS